MYLGFRAVRGPASGSQPSRVSSTFTSEHLRPSGPARLDQGAGICVGRPPHLTAVSLLPLLLPQLRKSSEVMERWGCAPSQGLGRIAAKT